MEKNLFILVSSLKELNSKAITLTRMQILSGLSHLKEEGATYRELKAALQISDGALYSNLKALEKMDYLKSKKEQYENKKLERYYLTEDGIAEWKKIKKWMYEFLEADEYEK